MFDRFTDEARAVVLEAQAEAVARGDRHLGCEHLLLGLLREGGGATAGALARRAVTLEGARAALDELVPPPAEVSTEEALATIGIDLGRVRARLEATFGPDAMAAPPPPYDDGAKRALIAAVAEAGPEPARVGTGHELLGLLQVPDGLAVGILAHLGVDVVALEGELRRSGRSEGPGS